MRFIFGVCDFFDILEVAFLTIQKQLVCQTDTSLYLIRLLIIIDRLYAFIVVQCNPGLTIFS